MPLSESSYLPPAAFVLSHVLGIAGVLYWRSRSREGRGVPGGQGGLRWPARPGHGLFSFPSSRGSVTDKDRQTDVSVGRREEGTAVGNPQWAPNPCGEGEAEV